MADTVLWLRHLDRGRLFRERFGSTPFADVPEDPYYRPSPGSFLSVHAWLDDDSRHVVIAHDCTETREVHILRWPTWQAVDGRVTPSYSCDVCGVHTFADIDAAPSEDTPGQPADRNEAQP